MGELQIADTPHDSHMWTWHLYEALDERGLAEPGLTADESNGAAPRWCIAQSGHRSADMVRKYIRDGSLFTSNAAVIAGL